MSNNQSPETAKFVRMIKKLFLSGFVVFTFIAYAIEQRFGKPESSINIAPANANIASAPQNLSSSGAVSAIPSPAPAQFQPNPAINQPIAEIAPTPTPNLGMYKDGTYTGQQIDAYYGIVEVQATIQNGKIANVQFLQYPNDRRTSVQINAIAMPYLQQEALQAQSARINIISGATFTSEGFAMSLNSALKSAKN